MEKLLQSDLGEGKNWFLEISEVRSYLESRIRHPKKRNERGERSPQSHLENIFIMIGNAYRRAGIDGSSTICHLLSEDNIRKALSEFGSINTRKTCRQALKGIFDWLKSEGKLGEVYVFPSLAPDEKGRHITPNDSLALFDPQRHVHDERMEFACLLAKEHGLRSYQIVNLKRESFGDTGITVTAGKGITRLIKLTKTLQWFISRKPHILGKQGYIFASGGKKITVKCLNQWLQRSLHEDYKGKVTMQSISRKTKYGQQEFGFE